MRIQRALLIPVAAAVVVLAGCSDDSSSTTASPSSGEAASQSCPTATPSAPASPEWTFDGTTGKVQVSGSTDTAAPYIKVDAPFSVATTEVHTLTAGTGPDVPANATVSVCYEGVNGRDGNVFDSSYQRGEPASFSLDGVIPGFTKAIAGQKVGSTVAVAIAPADGYPDGQPSANINKGDTLIFAIKILSAQG